MSEQSISSTDTISLLADLLWQEPLPKELEITILPFPENDEIDASSFIKDGIHLGIHAPHVPQIASDIRSAYRKYRSTILLQDGNGGRDIPDDIVCKYMDCISCLLLLCPDHATAWADRRRLLQLRYRTLKDASVNYDGLSFWDNEIRYMNLLFTQHSKSPNAWGHRKWVFRQVLLIFQSLQFKDRIEGAAGKLLQWCTPEIALCSVIAEKYPKNYYAWTYRGFLMKTIVQNLDVKNDDNCREEVCSFLQSELDFIFSWLFHHVSDHSAAHYGGEVASSLLLLQTSTSDKNQTRDDILLSSSQLLEKFSCHEVIWIWRRICFRVTFDSYCIEQSNDNKDTIQCIDSLLQDEIAFGTSFAKPSELSHNIENRDLQCQRYFSMAYLLWILRYALRHSNKLDSDHSHFHKKWTFLIRERVEDYKQVYSCDNDDPAGPSMPALLFETICYGNEYG